jgi:hypothetical protein
MLLGYDYYSSNNKDYKNSWDGMFTFTGDIVFYVVIYIKT